MATAGEGGGNGEDDDDDGLKDNEDDADDADDGGLMVLKEGPGGTLWLSSRLPKGVTYITPSISKQLSQVQS